jgi:hypothetical protein
MVRSRISYYVIVICLVWECVRVFWNEREKKRQLVCSERVMIKVKCDCLAVLVQGCRRTDFFRKSVRNIENESEEIW